MEELWSRRAVADRLGVSRTYSCDLAKSGQVPVVTVDNGDAEPVLVFKARSLLRFMVRNGPHEWSRTSAAEHLRSLQQRGVEWRGSEESRGTETLTTSR